eukprot:Skav203948  [mRNA]  locus=scaffold391:189942:190295:+ [translate_table: standard]
MHVPLRFEPRDIFGMRIANFVQAELAIQQGCPLHWQKESGNLYDLDVSKLGQEQVESLTIPNIRKVRIATLKPCISKRCRVRKAAVAFAKGFCCCAVKYKNPVIDSAFAQVNLPCFA